MSTEPKKVDRRKFIYAGVGAAIIILGASALYLATKPAENSNFSKHINCDYYCSYNFGDNYHSNYYGYNYSSYHNNYNNYSHNNFNHNTH